MKYFIIMISMIILSTIIIFSCKKEKDAVLTSESIDTVPPIIILKCANPYQVVLNAQFFEPGAIAFDVVNGDTFPCTVHISNNTPLIANTTISSGSWIETYTASDSAGNTSSLERTVIVENSMQPFVGNFIFDKHGDEYLLNGVDSAFNNQPVTVVTDNHKNNRIWFPSIAGIAGLQIHADVSNYNGVYKVSMDIQGKYMVETDTMLYIVSSVGSTPANCTSFLSDTIPPCSINLKYYIYKYKPWTAGNYSIIYDNRKWVLLKMDECWEYYHFD
jgi:hypothetical protein